MMKEWLPTIYAVNKSFVLACLFTSGWEGYTSTVKPLLHTTTLQSLISHLYFCLNSGHLWIPLHVWDKSEITGTADLKKKKRNELLFIYFKQMLSGSQLPRGRAIYLICGFCTPLKRNHQTRIRNTVGSTRRVAHHFRKGNQNPSAHS